MLLEVRGVSIPVTHMGPDFLFVKSAENHPPSNATMILQVDGSERRWQVRLPEGISTGSKRIAIASV
jgi:hypothetical protein